MTEKSYLSTLRDAARTCPDILMAKLLRDAADDLAEMLDLLHVMPTVERIQAVNSSWALANRLLSFVEDGGEPPPAKDAVGC